MSRLTHYLKDGRTAAEPKNRAEGLAFAAKLAGYEDAEESGTVLQLKFKPGSIVWALEKDEYDVYYESPEGYIFLAECCGYAIVFIEFAISHKDIKHQIEQLYEACIDECGASIRLVPIEDVFPTREEAVEAYKHKKECDG